VPATLNHQHIQVLAQTAVHAIPTTYTRVVQSNQQLNSS